MLDAIQTFYLAVGFLLAATHIKRHYGSGRPFDMVDISVALLWLLIWPALLLVIAIINFSDFIHNSED